MLAFTLALTGSCAAQEHKKARAPTTHDMVGVWVGFDRGGSEFIRLELHADGSGYFALVAPANFITHDYGVQVYQGE